MSETVSKRHNVGSARWELAKTNDPHGPYIVFLENCSVTRKVLVVEEKNELSWSAWRVCHRRLNENRLFVIHKEGLPISQEKQIPFSSVGLDSLTDDLY